MTLRNVICVVLIAAGLFIVIRRLFKLDLLQVSGIGALVGKITDVALIIGVLLIVIGVSVFDQGAVSWLTNNDDK